MLDPKNFANKFEFNRARFEAIDKGDLLLPGFLRPCRLKLLVVVDGDGAFVHITFGQLYFSLSAFLATLENNPEFWVKFDVTKAHRQTDPLGDADLEGFRFTQAGFDIDEYDEVWLFGARSDENDEDRLSDQELAVLSRWMDERQGGVFATGDHADLGASMCAKVPRVRSMRKWTGAQGAPSPNGEDRHDTLLPGHDTTYTFNDESDDVPMPIDVTPFPVRGHSLPFFRTQMPHPILCGRDGIIDVLPDHPHEGEVIDPVSLTNSFGFPGYTNKPEYPESSPGKRPKPIIIASAHVRARSDAQDARKGEAKAKTFGVIGAYDGHQVDVGRVVVDSTWHHWFDVNLIGRPQGGGDPIDPVPPSDPKAQGFLATPQGRAQWARIQNYFRNVAIWTAPPSKQRCMLFRALWMFIQRYPLAEQLDPKLPLVELGGYAIEAIGRRASRCTVRTWLLDLILPDRWLERFVKIPQDPCLTCPPLEVLEHVMIGSVVREMLELSYAARKRAEPASETAIAEAAARGISRGGEHFTEMLGRSLENSASLLRTLEANVLSVRAELFVADSAPRRPTRRPPAKKKPKARR